MQAKFIFAHFHNPQVSHIDSIGLSIIKGIKTVSRLSYKPDVLPFTLASESLSDLSRNIPTTSPTWEQCCEERVYELEKSRGRIYLMWSGGIDSTGALVSIMKWGTAELQNRVTILMSTLSYREFPEMFQTLCKKFSIKSVHAPLESYMKPEDILVTGELGDQLFGSDFIYTLSQNYGLESLFQPYDLHALELFKALTNKKNGQDYYDHLRPIVNECPFRLKTSYDFFWWWNFSQKWQHVKYRVTFLHFREPWKFAHAVFPFFDSRNFQYWSLLNHEKKIKSELVSYKWIAKDFIIKHTGFEQYGEKPKIGSLKNIHKIRPQWHGLLEDFTFATQENLKLHES